MFAIPRPTKLTVLIALALIAILLFAVLIPGVQASRATQFDTLPPTNTPCMFPSKTPTTPGAEETPPPYPYPYPHPFYLPVILRTSGDC